MSHTVLLINPNTSRPTTDMMVALAQACFQSLQRRDIQVRGLTAPEGPGMLTEMEELEQAAAISRHPQVLAQAQDVDGVIVGAFGDPGLQALTERVTVPVIGIGQASMEQAARAGTPFSIATTTPGLEQSILDQVQRYGWSKQFSGLRLTRDGVTYTLDLDQQARGRVYLRDDDHLYIPFLDAKEVFVVGEVMQPGAFDFRTGSISLSQALGRARGLAQTTANGNAVYVIRGSKDLETTPSAIYHLEAKSPAAFAVASQFELLPGDVVFVGSAGITRWNRFVTQLLPFSGIISNVARTNNDLR